MWMLDLPQELLDKIVSNVDVVSLKACALTATALVAPSQRILLRSLTIGVSDGTPSSSLQHARHPVVPARRLIEDSPHIASYITRLNVELLTVIAHSDALRILEEIFAALTNLRHCTLTAEPDEVVGVHTFKWADIMPAAFLDFLLRWHLQELCLQRITEIPGSVFLYILGAIPSLSLLEVPTEVLEDSVDSRLSEQLALRALFLGSGCLTVADLLCRPGFKCYTAGLRHLSCPNVSAPLLSRVAQTLTSLRFDCVGSSRFT